MKTLFFCVFFIASSSLTFEDEKISFSNHYLSQTFVQAGEIVNSQKSRVKDSYGSGQYGASRDKGTRTHNGIDILAKSAEKIFAPFDCTIKREVVPYKNDASYRGVLIEGKGKWNGYTMKIFYIEGLLSGAVSAGQEIGIVQNLEIKYPGIKNHIHVEVKKGTNQIDPFEIWQMSF